MINIIKDLLVNNGKIIPARTNINYLKKHKLYNFINNKFDNTYSVIEKIYCLTNDFKERPKCYCGNDIKYKNGYSTFCSRKCASNSDIVKDKNRKNVSLALIKAYKKSGDNIKSKREKTLKEKYNINSVSPFKSLEVREKIKKTNLIRYGVENVFELPKNRNLKWTKQNSILQWDKRGFNVTYITDKLLNVYNLCNKHNPFEIDIINFYNRANRNRNGIICPICNPINSFSSLELSFEDFLKEYEINYIKNDRNLIKPYELDFYLPEFNLAIELNGIYWHSELFKTKNYHLDKLEKCLENNIELIQIWEDDFYNKENIIKSMLLNKLGKSKNKIYARNCNIQNISSKEYKQFLTDNHLQGSINSSIRLGLFNNDKLVAVMGFGKLRKSLGTSSKNGYYELHRYASLLSNSIVGGASKLLSYFEKTIIPINIISYAKRDYSIGKLYEKLNFILIKKTEPGYYWIINGKRKHRYSFRKDKIINEENKNKSAIQIMHDLGYIRVFDSGNLKYEKQLNYR